MLVNLNALRHRNPVGFCALSETARNIVGCRMQGRFNICARLRAKRREEEALRLRRAWDEAAQERVAAEDARAAQRMELTTALFVMIAALRAEPEVCTPAM